MTTDATRRAQSPTHVELSCLSVVTLALALVVTPRLIAWSVLLCALAVLARCFGRWPGVVSAITAAYFYMVFHGPTRFQLQASDSRTIRMSLMLGALGVLAALVSGGQPERQ